MHTIINYNTTKEIIFNGILIWYRINFLLLFLYLYKFLKITVMIKNSNYIVLFKQ